MKEEITFSLTKNAHIHFLILSFLIFEPLERMWILFNVLQPKLDLSSVVFVLLLTFSTWNILSKTCRIMQCFLLKGFLYILSQNMKQTTLKIVTRVTMIRPSQYLIKDWKGIEQSFRLACQLEHWCISEEVSYRWKLWRCYKSPYTTLDWLNDWIWWNALNHCNLLQLRILLRYLLFRISCFDFEFDKGNLFINVHRKIIPKARFCCLESKINTTNTINIIRIFHWVQQNQLNGFSIKVL